MSGEALNNSQLRPSLLTAMDDCVRREARMVPARTRLQLWQLQFHCGNPPPAPAPNTLIFMLADTEGCERSLKRKTGLHLRVSPVLGPKSN